MIVCKLIFVNYSLFLLFGEFRFFWMNFWRVAFRVDSEYSSEIG